MGVKAIQRNLDHRNGNVGAMVGDALVVGQQIVQHKAVLDAARARLQTHNVAALDLAHQTVHDFLQRLDLFCRIDVVFLESVHRAVYDILHGGFQNAEVVEGFLAELYRFIADFLSGLDEVDGVVADALKVADGVQQRVDGAVIILREVLGAQFDKVGTQHVLVVVHGIFLARDLVRNGIVPDAGRGHSLQKRRAADLCHIAAHQHRAPDGDGGGGQQTFVQQGVLLAAVAGGIRHGHNGKALQHAVEGQQDRGGDHVEHGMHNGNAEGVGGFVKEAKADDGVQPVEPQQEHHGADEVEIQVDKGGALGVFVGARAGDQRRDGGADVLTHNDGHGGGKGDRPRGAERLQNTHAGRAGLQHGSKHRTGNNAQNGVFKAEEQLHKPRFVGKGTHGGGHNAHAGHQNGEAQHNFAHAAAAVLAEGVQPDTDKAQNGTPRIGVEHLGEEAVPLQAGKREQPAGDSGADVGAHNDADGLMQLHQTGVDKADRHNGGGAAGLNDRRDSHTQQQRAHRGGGHGGQDALQLAARGLLQRFAHQVHTVQEHRNAAHQGKHIKNAHGKFTHPFCCLCGVAAGYRTLYQFLL